MRPLVVQIKAILKDDLIPFWGLVVGDDVHRRMVYIFDARLQGYLAHKKQPPPPQVHHRALGIVLLKGPRGSPSFDLYRLEDGKIKPQPHI